MTNDNKRGAIRKNSDPVAIATKGRQTTYELDTSSVRPRTVLKTNGAAIILKKKKGGLTGTSFTFTLDTGVASNRNITFDIGTGVNTNAN